MNKAKPISSFIAKNYSNVKFFYLYVTFLMPYNVFIILIYFLVINIWIKAGIISWTKKFVARLLKHVILLCPFFSIL